MVYILGSRHFYVPLCLQNSETTLPKIGKAQYNLLLNITILSY